MQTAVFVGFCCLAPGSKVYLQRSHLGASLVPWFHHVKWGTGVQTSLRAVLFVHHVVWLQGSLLVLVTFIPPGISVGIESKEAQE